ncbi:MAG TPA: efflux RND transporter periplasmic adaptor subunit [Fimbriimonas sp.]
MSTHAEKPPRSIWLPAATAAGVLAVATAAYVALRRTPATPVVEQSENVRTVPAGEAGTVGDLKVTEEAMKLAEIRLAPVEARQVADKLEVSGSIQAGGDQLVKITPRVPGRIVRLLAGVGDDVRAGQTLAVIESPDLAAAQAAYRQAVARSAAAKADLKRQKQLARLGQFGGPQVEEARTRALEAERDIQAAEKELSEERTKLAEAASERQRLASLLSQAQSEREVEKARLDRAEALFREELIAKQELERIRADHQKAEADARVAEASLAQGDARIVGTRARIVSAERELSLARRRSSVLRQSLGREEKVFRGNFLTNREIVQAESALSQALVEAQAAAESVRLLGGRPGGGNTVHLASPLAGRVQERTATLGETIDPEHAAFTVVNLDRVWAQLAVLPGDLSSVRVGDRVQLTSETTGGRVFTGAVLSIGTRADETTRAVPVRTTLDNPGKLLKPGSFVRGTIVTEVRRQRTVVPLAALQEHTGRPTLYVAKGGPGEFEVRHVKLGVQGPTWREISAGIQPGEKIATGGTFYLKSEAMKDALSDGCCAPGG